MHKKYESISDNLVRHEVIVTEVANKLDHHHEVLTDLGHNITELKKYAVMSDLHMEAYLPLQIANIAFDLGKCIVKKSGMEKYCQQVMKKVISPLERNLLNLCDPGEYQYVSRYKKMTYKLPEDLTRKDKAR